MNLRTLSLLNKLGTIGTGHFLSFVINNWFDYGVYVPVITFWGPFYGCGVMIILSMMLNLSLIKGYDWSQKDWLGFELIKEGKGNLSSKLPKWLQWTLRSGDILAFIGLSIYDPFLAVIFLRKREQAFKGLSARDWKIFLSATILSNVGWTTLVYGGLSAFQWFLKTAQMLW